MLRTSESKVLKEMSRTTVLFGFQHRSSTEDKAHFYHPVRRIILHDYITQAIVEFFLNNTKRKHDTVIPGH